MASILQLVGRWRLVDSKGFDEYMKELGVGMALRKMGAMAKPDCVITSDGKHLTVKMESTLKTTQFSCDLGEKFEETTADGRKTQTVCNFVNGALVQHQEWDGKESTITRKLENGKLMVNPTTCCEEAQPLSGEAHVGRKQQPAATCLPCECTILEGHHLPPDELSQQTQRGAERSCPH